MKSFKKLLSAALATALALTLVSCGGGGGTSSGSSGTDDASSGGEVNNITGVSDVSEYSVQPVLDDSVDYTQGESYSFIIATDGAEDRVDGLLVHYMADQLEAITGGRIQLQMYFNGSMGTDTELCESTQAGDVAFFLGSTAFTANFVPELNVIDLPFLYTSPQQYRDTMDDETVFNYFRDRYEENNFELIGFFDQGMREMTTNTLVQTPEDLHGQRIRVMENQLHIAIWEALGASPTPMAFSEVYMALQQGTIDAQENPFEVIYANRIYEQQDYVIMTNHLAASHNLLFSKVIFDGMSETDQALIMAVGEAAIQYAREQCDARLSDRMALVEEAGCEIVELEPEVQQQLRDLCAGIYDDLRATYGDELVDMQIDAAERHAA